MKKFESATLAWVAMAILLGILAGCSSARRSEAPAPAETTAAVTPAPRASSAVSMPPSAAPEAAAPSPSSSKSAAAAPERTYRIAPGDTLLNIARTIHDGSGGDVDQTMIALYRANPNAFGGNINILRRGSVLRVPGADEIAALNQSEAMSEVHRQMDAWRGNSATASSGHLRLVTPAAGSGASNPSSESAYSAEAQALTGRVQDLEQQLADAHRLLDLKNNELSELQRKFGTQARATTPTPTPPPPAELAPPPRPGAKPPAATAANPAGKTLNSVQVFFGTDRDYNASNLVNARFGAGRGSIRYGTAEVSIPPDHKLGNLESPSLLRLEFSPDPKKHVVLKAITVLSASDYFRQLADTVQAATGKSALVFVHGYNVSFADAARRTAQMTYDLQFVGAPIFFSWPSVGRVQDYAVDETNVEWARPHLTQFLVDVLSRTNAADVYLIAHSMGNRALASSVADVEISRPELRAKIREIILAAPDIDADTFRDEIAPRIIAAELPTTHLTLYASSNDEALLASKTFHGYARAGDAGDLQLMLAGLEYIDASSVDTEFLGHSYYGDNRSVIADIHYLIDGHLRACKRFSLKEIQLASGNRCVFSH